MIQEATTSTKCLPLIFPVNVSSQQSPTRLHPQGTVSPSASSPDKHYCWLLLSFRRPLQWLSLLLQAQSPQLLLFPHGDCWVLISLNCCLSTCILHHLEAARQGSKYFTCPDEGSLHQCYLKPQRKRAAISKCQQWQSRPLPIHTCHSSRQTSCFPGLPHTTFKKQVNQKPLRICQLGHKFLPIP